MLDQDLLLDPRHILALCIPVAVVSFLLCKTLHKPQTTYRYPPGPKGIPVFGSLFELPPKNPGRKLLEWAAQYGDIFSVHIGSRRWVFLNSIEAVHELLDRRGRLYISRPRFSITQDIASGGKRVVLMSHTETWRQLRKVMHQLLMASNLETYKPFQDLESKALVWRYLKKPHLFHQHAASFSNSVIFSVVFGRRTSMREEKVQLLFSTSEDFLASQTTPSTTLIEQFPGLVDFIPKPLQWFRPNAERIYRRTLGVYTDFLNDLADRVKQGQDPQCFGRNLNDVAEKYGFDDAQKAFCAGTLIEAGSDTTRNQINIMIAAAAKFPTWANSARKQLDAVCGRNAARLPSFDDWNDLPYIIAVIKESLRWRPNLVPSGVPRALIEDDKFRDYVFEKGTIFTYNSFAISHDEKEFAMNEVFMPERYLNEDLQELLKGHIGFGAGRRLCPGYHVATRNMFIAFSRLLYCYEFKEVPGAPINEWEIEAMAHERAPFKIQIIPRSEEHVQLIEKECAALALESESA